MAAGEYISMRAQTELFERELEIERRELRRSPHAETMELSRIYESRGVQPTRARALAEEMMRDPDLALETHAREELGIDPSSLGSPWSAALSSFIAFTIGAVIPLVPWFFSTGTAAVVASVILGAIAAVAVGVALANLTGRSWVWSGLRQLTIAAGAASVTFAVGRIVGVGVS